MAGNRKYSLVKGILRIFIAAGLLAALQGLFITPVRAQIPQTACSEIWDFVITVTDHPSGSSKALRLGQGLTATSGADNCDAPAPPVPPTGSFDARLSNGTSDFFVDYRRANLPGTITWLLKFQPNLSAAKIILTWNPATLPGAGSWILRDSFGGVLVNLDMRQFSSLDVTNYALSPLNIIYTTPRCTVTAVASGDWNSPDTWNTNCSGLPAATDDVYIPAGLAVNFNAAATTVESLTLGSAASLTHSNANLLTVSDNAYLRGGTLNLGSTGSLTVAGKLTNLGVMQQTKTVNVLDGEGAEAPDATQTFLNIGGYGGLTLTSTATSLGSTTVEIKGGQICDTDNTSVWRCFTIKPANNAADATVVFSYAQNELNTSACATLQAWRFTGGQSWASAGTLGTRSCAAEPYSVSYSGVTLQNTGSDFNLRSTSSPTAIELNSLNTGQSAVPGAQVFILAGLLALSVGLGAASLYLRRGRTLS